MSQLKIKNGNNWESIPAGGVGVPSGGSAGDILVKSSSTDYATEWQTKPELFKIVTISNTWSNIPKNGGRAYVDISNVPDGYIPISCSLEVTSALQYSSWITVYNPTRYYDTTASIHRGWMTRLQNNEINNALTVTGTIRVLCIRETQ